MKIKQVYDRPRTYVVVLATGEEVAECLTTFAAERKPGCACFTAIGAFESCTLGYFDWQSKKYFENPVAEQVEVLSLVGNFTWDGDKPKLHAHVVVGMRDGSARGGHLLKGRVRPTLEVTVVEAPAHLQRRYDAESHLALIQFDR